MTIRKYIYTSIFLLSLFLLSSCDEHEEVDPTIHVGYVLCDNFETMPLSQYLSQDRVKAIGVVFAEKTEEHPTLAVSLDEIRFCQFADSLYSQGTSCDIEAFDGIANTNSLQNSYDKQTGHGSPLANIVYSNMPFGHSYAVPSVAEMRLMVMASGIINPILETLDGMRIRNDERDCWYWTSTEVEENRANQAWSVSSATGTWMQMPKENYCRARSIITLNY